MNYMFTIFAIVIPIIWILILIQEELENINYDRYYNGVVAKLIKVFVPMWLVIGLIITIKTLAKYNVLTISTIILIIGMFLFEESVRAIVRFIESKINKKNDDIDSVNK